MPLETGHYQLFSSEFGNLHRVLVADPEDSPNREVIAKRLPPGHEAHSWYIEKINDVLFTLAFNGQSAKIVNGQLRLTSLPGPHFVWEIISQNSAPPDPDVYGISVPEKPYENWFVRGGDPAVKVPVLIFDTRTPILFRRVHE